MTILNKSTAPNGIYFQLEDWSEDYSCFSYGSTIGAYPKKYAHVRCQCDFENHNEALQAFEKLQNGEATIFDFNFTVMVAGGYRKSIKDVFDLKKFEYIYGQGD